MISKFKKINIFIVVFLIISMFFLNSVYSISEIFTGVDKFRARGTGAIDDVKEAEVKKASSTVYKVLLTIGIIVAIGVGSVVAIKILLGTVEEKVEYKEFLIPYILGVVVLFGAFTIWSIAINLSDDLITASTGAVSVGGFDLGDNSGGDSGAGGEHIEDTINYIYFTEDQIAFIYTNPLEWLIAWKKGQEELTEEQGACLVLGIEEMYVAGNLPYEHEEQYFIEVRKVYDWASALYNEGHSEYLKYKKRAEEILKAHDKF